MKKVFTPEQFKASKFSSAADKAKFANHFIHFMGKGYPRSLFPKWFYTRLSMCFGHIAHYHQEGFYSEFFTTELRQCNFIRITMNYPCYGDPEYTYSDVEKAIQEYLRGN